LGLVGNCGRPFEYFHPDAVDGITCLPREGGNFREDLARVLAEGTTTNGVFGVKTHWGGFLRFIQKAKQMEPYNSMDAPEIIRSILPNVRYIRLRRKDIFRQTVSLAKAQQSRVWAVPANGPHPGTKTLKYSYFRLCDLHDFLVRQEAAWAEYFRKYLIDALEISYEDIVADYEETIKRVQDYLHVKPADGQSFSVLPLKRLSDEVNENWYRRYRRTPAVLGRSYMRWKLFWKILKQVLSRVFSRMSYAS
jgi:LPS sulfotransferase NodH